MFALCNNQDSSGLSETPVVGEMDTLVGTMIATQRQNCGRGPVDRAVMGGCSRSGRASPGRNTEAGTCRMGRAMGW